MELCNSSQYSADMHFEPFSSEQTLRVSRDFWFVSFNDSIELSVRCNIHHRVVQESTGFSGVLLKVGGLCSFSDD